MQKFVLIILSTICFFSCSKAQETASEKKESLKDKKVLIVYLSRTENTKTVAEIIYKNTGGDLVELELQNPYPENYKAIVEKVSKENESGFLPSLKTKIDDIDKFDVVFIGFPTWGMQLPPPMKSFLKQYDLKGKTIIPFNTNAGYGIGSSFETVKELSSESEILEGFTMKGGIERDGILFVMEGKKKIEAEKKVREWLTKIGLNKTK
ncbi:flavodoxin [Chryseobacterium aquaticum]|uniref:Flavodoxin n=1 Tax=Chryseobacterium aquaticum TaxID=452084 RepID=A0A848N2L5_9FLAO|nr:MULTISPECIES: flavodoxin [Chryseobacterium]NMR33232.1 flavodoxin [Chryseobacterium aquaticum]NRQ44836.1 flavodoxin [Chryseobacterium sp. C-204]